jgi:hypothetical protein
MRHTPRLAAEILRDRPAQGAPSAGVEQAVIAGVSAGAAADGSALVTVTWRGASTQAAYLASYSPTVGHVVAVVVQGGALLILGRVIGTPPS